MYLKERERNSDADKRHSQACAELHKENATTHKEYARAYREILERVLVSDHHSIEAIDKMRASLEVAKRVEMIEKNVNDLQQASD